MSRLLVSVKTLGDRLCEAGRSVWHWAFPPRVETPPGLASLLAAVYPRLDLSRVDFRLGMPHVLRLGPYEAITLPEAFGVRRVGIYVRPRSFRTDEVEGLGILVHEAYHALQIQEMLGGWGLGLVRPFPVLYLACAAANGFGYDGHPIETDAYLHAGRRASRFDRSCRACSEAGEEFSTSALFGRADDLVVATSGIEFWRKSGRSAGLAPLGRWGAALGRGWNETPRRRPMLLLAVVALLPLAVLALVWWALWLSVWTATAAILWGLSILVAGAAAGVAAGLYGVGALLRLAPTGAGADSGKSQMPQ